MENAKRVLICGSRDYADRAKMVSIMSNLSPRVTIIEGGARGADTMARNIAEMWGWEVIEYPANWKKFGISAGSMRNKQMLDEGKPDLVLAFYASKEKSKGTKNMVEQAKRVGVRVIEYI